MAKDKFLELVEIFKRLRDPQEGCPWDIKQTHQSLVKHLIEESYELKDAIENDPSKLQEELGDVLLQVMLHSQIAADEENFNIYDVISTLSEKLIERHPHVFGDETVGDAEEVKKNWDKIKTQKKNQQKNGQEKIGRLDGLPKSAPALIQADLIGQKVAAVNFDWATPQEVMLKVCEELEELNQAKSQEDKLEELGDLFFTLAQYARKLGFSAEDVAQLANQKFVKRFEMMEEISDKDLSDCSDEELQSFWLVAKSLTK